MTEDQIKLEAMKHFGLDQPMVAARPGVLGMRQRKRIQSRADEVNRLKDVVRHSTQYAKVRCGCSSCRPLDVKQVTSHVAERCGIGPLMWLIWGYRITTWVRFILQLIRK